LNKLFPLLAFSILLLVPAGAQDAYAAGVLFGSDAFGNLFTINVVTGVITTIGNFGPIGGQFNSETTDIECTSDGLSCFSECAAFGFCIEPFDITIPSVTGAPISHGGPYNGLEFVGNTLFGIRHPANGGPFLDILNPPLTGTPTPVGSTGTTLPMSGLAHDTSSGIMYGVDGGGGGGFGAGPGNLYTINLGTGLATLVGNTGQTLGSLQFGPDGLLYAGGNKADGGNIYRINTATGAATFFTSSTFPSVTGLTLVGDEVVGGEFLPIDNTALLLAGLQTSAIWMLPLLAGAVGAGVYFIKTRMNKDN